MLYNFYHENVLYHFSLQKKNATFLVSPFTSQLRNSEADRLNDLPQIPSRSSAELECKLSVFQCCVFCFLL